MKMNSLINFKTLISQPTCVTGQIYVDCRPCTGPTLKEHGGENASTLLTTTSAWQLDAFLLRSIFKKTPKLEYV